MEDADDYSASELFAEESEAAYQRFLRTQGIKPGEDTRDMVDDRAAFMAGFGVGYDFCGHGEVHSGHTRGCRWCPG
jgi:hypothetical protein